MTQNLTLIFVVIGAVSIMCQWLAWRIKLPAILFLILCGLAVGPGLHWLKPDLIFGDLLSPLVSLSVSVILFEGSLTLNFHDIKEQHGVVRNLISLGLIIAWLLGWLYVHLIFNVGWSLACLFGAILTISGPTVILPMLRTLQPKRSLMNIMRWEGILIDPIGAILAVLIFTLISQDTASVSRTLIEILSVIGIGVVSGCITGWVLGNLFVRCWIPEFLQNIATLAFVTTLFALVNHIEEGAGLLAVTAMGITLANMKDVHIEDILNFKASLSILLISALFIVLAANIKFAALSQVIVPSLLLFLAMQFIVRPASVFISTLGSKLELREKILLAWISPKGIVCAAMAAIFSYQLKNLNHSQADAFILVTFLIILFTVIFQSITARPLARLLKVSNPEPTGYLIIGANPVARCIASALQQHDQHVMIIDNTWSATREARMAGIPVFYGRPVSEYADRHMELIGLGHVLALTPRHDLNMLSCLRYSKEFGKQNAFMIATGDSNSANENKGKSGSLLFGRDISFAKLASLIAKGAQTKSTKLTTEFTLEDFLKTHGTNAVPLFTITQRGDIRFFPSNQNTSTKPGDTLISLVPGIEN